MGISWNWNYGKWVLRMESKKGNEEVGMQDLMLAIPQAKRNVFNVPADDADAGFAGKLLSEGGDTDWGCTKTFPYDVELEAPVRETEDGHYCMEILMEGSAATAYVNSEAALRFRMYDFTERKLGLFSFGKADFSNILMKRKGEVYDKSNVTGGA